MITPYNIVGPQGYLSSTWADWLQSGSGNEPMRWVKQAQHAAVFYDQRKAEEIIEAAFPPTLRRPQEIIIQPATEEDQIQRIVVLESALLAAISALDWLANESTGPVHQNCKKTLRECRSALSENKKVIL